MGLLQELRVKVEDVFRQKAKTKLRTYRDLVFDVANGKPPSAAEIARILEEAGRSQDDLWRDVALREQRVALRAIAEQGTVAAKDRAEVAKEWAIVNREWEASQAKYKGIAGELQGRQRVAETQEQAAADARRRLVDGCDDPALLAKQEDLDRRRQEVRSRKDAVAPSIAHRHKLAVEQEVVAGSRLAESNREAARQLAQGLREGLEVDAVTMRGLDGELRALDAEQLALDDKKALAP